MAGLVLLALGLSFVVFGAIFIAEGLPKQQPSGGVREALLGLGALVVAIGALRAWAAYLIGKHRRGGLELGLGIRRWVRSSAGSAPGSRSAICSTLRQAALA